MRVVAGRFRGHVLLAPKGRALRPTADRVREALFNRLVHADWGRESSNPVIDARVIDVFAGTGALGIEALSRGAARVIFIDNDAVARAAIERNLRGLKVKSQFQVIDVDALDPPPTETANDLILMDPPYGTDLAAPALTALKARGWIAPDAIVVVEHPVKRAFDPPPTFAVIDSRRYGITRLIFLKST